jgi:hypothetical protein
VRRFFLSLFPLSFLLFLSFFSFPFLFFCSFLALFLALFFGLVAWGSVCIFSIVFGFILLFLACAVGLREG